MKNKYHLIEWIIITSCLIILTTPFIVKALHADPNYNALWFAVGLTFSRVISYAVDSYSDWKENQEHIEIVYT